MAQVQLSRVAARDLARLPKPYLAAVAAALRGLADEPFAGKPLRGDLLGLRSLRVGTYRAVYSFDPRAKVVQVIWIRHRSEAYRDAR